MNFNSGFWEKVGLLCACWIVIAVALLLQPAESQVRTELSGDPDGKIKTVYSTSGRPVNQSEQAKGWHRVSDSVQLSAGQTTVTLNTSTENGAYDVSFLNFGTYHGQAHSSDTSKTYRVIPLTGSQFLIKSSDGSDTATVYFTVEGE